MLSQQRIEELPSADTRARFTRGVPVLDLGRPPSAVAGPEPQRARIGPYRLEPDVAQGPPPPIQEVVGFPTLERFGLVDGAMLSRAARRSTRADGEAWEYGLSPQEDLALHLRSPRVAAPSVVDPEGMLAGDEVDKDAPRGFSASLLGHRKLRAVDAKREPDRPELPEYRHLPATRRRFGRLRDQFLGVPDFMRIENCGQRWFWRTRPPCAPDPNYSRGPAECGCPPRLGWRTCDTPVDHGIRWTPVYAPHPAPTMRQFEGV